MVLFALITTALVIVGTWLTHVLWQRLDRADAAGTGFLELLTAGTLVGICGWLALNWVLALTHTLNATYLWAAVILLFIAAAAVTVPRVKLFAHRELSREEGWTLLLLLPLFLWVVFILWRGTVLPPASHDVLAYHLPKAVLLARAEGFELFFAPDPRISRFPFNYELLLANILILGKSDRITEWVGTASYLMLLIATAAISRRWWRSNLLETIAAVLVTAAAPVLLLHSGADKNDLLTAFFAVTALFWGGRWVVRGGRMPMMLTILALGFGFGTKSSIAAIGLALAPFVLWRVVRVINAGTFRWRDIALTVTGVIAVFVLGGSVSYLTAYLALPPGSPITQAGRQITTIAYGDWSNYWQVPYLMLTVPFSSSEWWVWVPWRREYWFWPQYEIYFSHLGRLFTVVILVFPVTRWWFRRRGAAHNEPDVVIAAAFLAIAIMLPTQLRPVGFFGTFSRYFVFLVPFIVAATLPPLIHAASRASRRIAVVLVAALAIAFSTEAMLCFVYDRFAPPEYVQYAVKNRGTRVIWFNPFRAGSVVDRYAAPGDKIAVDGAFDTWVYPAYGARLTRPVVFLPPLATPADIPADADWVIVDRSWNALWANPKFEHMGQLSSYIRKGSATPEDLRLYLALREDRSFELIYRDEISNQAVFRRVRTSGKSTTNGEQATSL
jgi:hypothetical protein